MEKLRKLRLTLWGAGLVAVSYCSRTVLPGTIGAAFSALQRELIVPMGNLWILFPDSCVLSQESWFRKTWSMSFQNSDMSPT